MERQKNRHQQITSMQARQTAIQKFTSNPLALAGSMFILLLTLVCLLGPWIRPDQSLDANEQHLVLAKLRPGEEIQFIRVRKENQVPVSWLEMWWQGGREADWVEIPVSQASLVYGKLMVEPMDISDIELTSQGFDPSALYSHDGEGVDAFIFHRTFWAGTDKYGRDLLSRLMAGASVSLSVGAIAVIISLLIGISLGLLAGYFRGWPDRIIMWFTNVVWSIPTLILVMAITFAFGTGYWKIFLAVGLTMWVEIARLVRGQVLSVREKEYIEAARVMGLSDVRIMFVHILPNIISPVIVMAAANFASAILVEAGLSFLGLGAQIPSPSWGNIIREHVSFITTGQAYLALVPGLLMMLLVLSFMMVGNGLRDALDVRD
ncbi:MAG: ABC transporter permease [Flavobacteriales bacterium]